MKEQERVPYTKPEQNPEENGQRQPTGTQSTRVVYLRERGRRSGRSRPWYNQGWFWLLVTAVAIMLIVWQLQSILGALHLQTSAIQGQTDAIREQTSSLQQLLGGIQHAIDTLIQTIRDGVRDVIARMNQQ